MRGGKAAHVDHRACRDNTVPIRSGLFEAVPRNVIVLPVLFEDRVKAVIELASLERLHRFAPGVPRTTYRQHRHRAEQY